MLNLPEDEDAIVKKRNRAKRLSPRKHKIAHESGRSTKTLWRQIVEKATKSKRATSR